MQSLPLVGVSCNFFHPDPHRDLFKGKRLVYHEQRMTQVLASHGVIPVSICHTELEFTQVLDHLQGLVLGGGVDVCPKSYGRTQYDSRWPGDEYQDRYEIELVKGARKRGLPIFGLCRGAQILNVALGGTLFQDIQTERPESLVHRDSSVYDQLNHSIKIEKGSLLHHLYQKQTAVINSVHHQAIDGLGEGLTITARSTEDGIVESIERVNEEEYLVGVQWHPEWITTDSNFLDPRPLFRSFVERAHQYQQKCC